MHNNVDNSQNVVNNYTTVAKSAAEQEQERMEMALKQFRERCKQSIKRTGVLTEAEARKLYAEAEDFGITRDKASRIISEAKDNAAYDRSVDVSESDRATLEGIVETMRANELKANDPNIKDCLAALVIFLKTDDERGKFYYYACSAILDRGNFIADYLDGDKATDSYWQTFWAYIALLKHKKSDKAAKVMEKLRAFNDYSDDNLALLSAVSHLLAKKPQLSKGVLKRCDEPHPLLGDLYLTLRHLVDMPAGAQHLTGNTVEDFYLQNIFGLDSEHSRLMSGFGGIGNSPDTQQRSNTRLQPISFQSISSQPTIPTQPTAPPVASPTTPTAAPAATPSATSNSPAKGKKRLITLIVLAVIVGMMYKGCHRGSKTKDKETATTEEVVSTEETTTITTAPATTSTKSRTSSSGSSSASSISSSSSSTGSTSSSSSVSSSSSTSSSSTTSTSGSSSSTSTANKVETLTASAAAGSAAAKYELSQMYSSGNGVTKDATKAFTLMKEAAEAGYTQAYFPLGQMYHGGRGTTKNRDTAAYWYKKAADNGNTYAQDILNDM